MNKNKSCFQINEYVAFPITFSSRYCRNSEVKQNYDFPTSQKMLLNNSSYNFSKNENWSFPSALVGNSNSPKFSWSTKQTHTPPPPYPSIQNMIFCNKAYLIIQKLPSILPLMRQGSRLFACQGLVHRVLRILKFKKKNALPTLSLIKKMIVLPITVQ